MYGCTNITSIGLLALASANLSKFTFRGPFHLTSRTNAVEFAQAVAAAGASAKDLEIAFEIDDSSAAYLHEASFTTQLCRSAQNLQHLSILSSDSDNGVMDRYAFWAGISIPLAASVFSLSSLSIDGVLFRSKGSEGDVSNVLNCSCWVASCHDLAIFRRRMTSLISRKMSNLSKTSFFAIPTLSS